MFSRLEAFADYDLVTYLRAVAMHQHQRRLALPGLQRKQPHAVGFDEHGGSVDAEH